jgi:hypothetical protein
MTTQQPLDRFETELLAELRTIVADAGGPAAAGPPRWRRPAISIGVAAAATAAVFVATSGVGPGGTSTASASEVLLGAARHAESAAATDGVYWQVHTIESWDEGKAHGSLDERQWQRKDGTVWAADGGEAPHLIQGSGFSLCDKDVDYATLRALPTEPTALRAALEDAMRHGDDGAVPADAQDRFVTDCTIGLLTMPVSNTVRGAAYRSLAALPGTENLGTTTDRQGRTGTELVFREGSETQHVVVDADSGNLLQFDFAGEKGQRQGTVLDAGWTDSLPR